LDSLPVGADPPKRYWRIDPYIQNFDGRVPHDLYNGPGWWGRDQYFGRSAGMVPDISDRMRFTHVVQQAIHPRPGEMQRAQAELRRLKLMVPDVPSSIGY